MSAQKSLRLNIFLTSMDSCCSKIAESNTFNTKYGEFSSAAAFYSTIHAECTRGESLMGKVTRYRKLTTFLANVIFVFSGRSTMPASAAHKLDKIRPNYLGNLPHTGHGIAKINSFI